MSTNTNTSTQPISVDQSVDELDGQRVVVFGGTGFIGRWVVEELLTAAAEVTIVGRSKPVVVPAGAQVAVGSIRSPDLVARAVAGADTVICLASTSLPNAQDLRAEISGHVEPTVASAVAAAQAGASRFIFASSGGTVYGSDSERPLRETDRLRPRNGYGASKLMIEHYLRLLGAQTGMQTVSLRVSNPFGEGQRAERGQGFIAAVFAHLYQGDDLNIWGDGSAVRDFVDVADVARAFTAACTYSGSASELNVGSGIGRSLLAVLEAVGAVAGRDPEPVFEPGRTVDVAMNVLDVSLAKAELGWVPRLSFAESLRLTDAWWRSGRGDPASLASPVSPRGSG